MAATHADVRARLFAHEMAGERLRALHERAARSRWRLHLVGGAVRDALYDMDVADFDFAVPGEALSLVRPWAQDHGGTAISLYEDPPTRRVVFPDGMSVDFVQFRAPTIDEDLAARDYTVNAIALELGDLLHGDGLPMLDPCGGLRDLRERRLRCAGERSLTDDPLRILRAFRLMATHRMRLAESARGRIVEHAARLRDVAGERVRDEISRLLQADHAFSAVRALDDARVLDVVFPELPIMRGAAQNDYHHLDVWEHTLDALDEFERSPIPDALSSVEESARGYLSATIGQGMTGSAIIKLALLFHDCGKPATRTVDEQGRMRYIGHEKVGADHARAAAARLQASRRVRHTLRALVEDHLITMHLSAPPKVSPRALKRYLRHTGDNWCAVLMLSWADLRASRGPARTAGHFGRTAKTMAAIAKQHLEDEASRSQAEPLVTGKDVLNLCGVQPGPQVGRLLEQVDNARLDGMVRSRRDALSLLRRLSRQDDR